MILVTGGTGIVGAHLLYFLLRENESVRAIHRKGSDIDSVKSIFSIYTSEVDILFSRIDWIEADITDIPALTEAFENVKYVYHCAALVSFNPAQYSHLKKINIEGTANIVNMCLAKGVEKLCYVSSVATFGNVPEGNYIDEKTAWNPDTENNVYAISKYGAEMEVWRGTQEGLDAVIVNPGIIFGISPKEEGSGMITKIASTATSYYPPGGMGIVDVRDVARAMILLMHSEIRNEQFILVGHNVSYREILDRFALLYGNPRPIKKLSKSLTLFLSFVDWITSTLFGSKRKLYKSMVHSMFSSSLYDSSRIKEQLGLEFTSLEDTLENVVRVNRN